jgi:hypothetical protein
MNMNIAPGGVVVPTPNNTGSVLCYSDAVEVVTSPTAPASGTNRYDVVVCQARGNDLDGGSNNDFLFQVVSGVASASPAVPAIPAGAVAIARVLVIGGSASLSSANLVDLRVATPYAARMWRNAAFNIVHAATTVIPFDTVSYDYNANLTVGAAAKYTVPAAGLYEVKGRISWSVNNTVEDMMLDAYQNGAIVSLGNRVTVRAATAADRWAVVINDTIACAAGDLVDLRVQFGGGGNDVAADVGATWSTYFAVRRV